jgi:hypothetical protein
MKKSQKYDVKKFLTSLTAEVAMSCDLKPGRLCVFSQSATFWCPPAYDQVVFFAIEGFFFSFFALCFLFWQIF